MNFIEIHQRIYLISNFHRYINIVERRIASALPTIHSRYVLLFCYFDREMASFSIGLL